MLWWPLFGQSVDFASLITFRISGICLSRVTKRWSAATGPPVVFVLLVKITEKQSSVSLSSLIRVTLKRGHEKVHQAQESHPQKPVGCVGGLNSPGFLRRGMIFGINHGTIYDHFTNTCTGWQFHLFKTSNWLQNKSSTLAWPGQAKMEILFWSQREVLNKWNFHPVETL